MSKPTDIRVIGARLYFIPIQTRLPLKFGTETVTSVTCARVCVRVADRSGKTAEGWGETPLSVQWVWPSPLPYESRHVALKDFCVKLAAAWATFEARGHPVEVGVEFQEQALPELLADFNRKRDGEAVPWLAALVCCSLFDLAMHDAFGESVQRPVYQTYTAQFMNRDLGEFLVPAKDSGISFAGKFPSDFLVKSAPKRLRAWHLVGGLDLLDAAELKGDEPNDGYPVLLPDWIERDGLKCLKVK